MLDTSLRPAKDRMLRPLAGGALRRVHPAVFTAGSLVFTLAAAVAAWEQRPLVAVAFWLVGRLADGLDGAVARAQDRSTDLGGLLDIVGDTIGYAAIPLGIAAGADTQAAWVVVSILLATFYVNSVSWTYLSALIEKRANRSRGPSAVTATTAVAMPRGLIEGTETIIFFTVALAVPSIAVWVLAVMAGLVAFTALERVLVARRLLEQ